MYKTGSHPWKRKEKGKAGESVELDLVLGSKGSQFILKLMRSGAQVQVSEHEADTLIVLASE